MKDLSDFTTKRSFENYLSKEIIKYKMRIRNKSERFFTSDQLSYLIFKHHHRFKNLDSSLHSNQFGFIKAKYFEGNNHKGYRLSVKIKSKWFSFSYKDIWCNKDVSVKAKEIARQVLKDRWPTIRAQVYEELVGQWDVGSGLFNYEGRPIDNSYCDMCKKQLIQGQIDIHHSSIFHKEIVDRCIDKITEDQKKALLVESSKLASRDYSSILGKEIALYDRISSQNHIYKKVCKSCHKKEHYR